MRAIDKRNNAFFIKQFYLQDDQLHYLQHYFTYINTYINCTCYFYYFYLHMKQHLEM